VIEILRSVIRPYKIGLDRASRDLKIRAATPQSRRILYVSNPHLDAQSEVRAAVHEISIAVYLDTDNQEKIDVVLGAVGELRQYAGFGDEHDVVVKRGSIFHRARAFLVRGVTAPEVADRLTKLERALELTHLDSKQAEVDSTTAGAVQQIIESISDIDRACIRAGSLLVLKFQAGSESVILVRNLSQIEIRAFERCPEIQTKPEAVLTSLSTVVESMASIEAIDTISRRPLDGTA
jgi:hypothetical protein